MPSLCNESFKTKDILVIFLENPDQIAKTAMAQPNEVQLEWIQMRKDFNEDRIESPREKFMRKFKQNPLVPIGEFISAC